MKKFVTVITALVALASLFVFTAAPAAAAETINVASTVASDVCNCACCNREEVIPFEFDEKGMPKSIDFEDAIQLATVELTEGIFGYTVRETGHEVEITDDYVIDETKLRLAETKFGFAHSAEASYVFYGVDASDNYLGNYQLKSDELEKMVDTKEVGYAMLETKKVEDGVKLSNLLGKAMRAFWNVETEQWDICFVESALEKLVAKVETKVEIKVETDVETKEETEEEETEEQEQETVQQHTCVYAEYVYTATCTEAGYSIFKCECGANYKVVGEAAHGHVWDNGTVTVAPTEEAEGTKTYTCTECGAEKSETIAKVEHKHNHNKVEVAEATCTENGYVVYTCKCGDSYKVAGEAAKGHQWDNGVVTVNPTEDAEGTKTYTCTECGAEKSENIAKLVHKHNYEVVVRDATCTEAGYTTYTCACGNVQTIEGEEAHGHAWDNGTVTVEPTVDCEGTRTYTCTECGAEKSESIAKLEVSDDVADDLDEPSNNEDPRDNADDDNTDDNTGNNGNVRVETPGCHGDSNSKEKSDDTNDDTDNGNVRYETEGCHGDSNREDKNDTDDNTDNNGNVRYEAEGCHGDGVNGNSNNRAPKNNNNPVTRGGSSANPMSNGVAGDLD